MIMINDYLKESYAKFIEENTPDNVFNIKNEEKSEKEIVSEIMDIIRKYVHKHPK